MELQNKLYTLNVKRSTEKIKKVINIFFISKFIKRLTWLKVMFPTKERDTAQNKVKAG